MDLSFLLGRGYGDRSAGLLVGNRYSLNARQIQALYRISCSEKIKEERNAKKLDLSMLNGANIEIDGYNLLIVLEVALSGGFVFESMDGCYRDIAGIHGTYKKVEETIPALEMVGKTLQELGVAHVQWFFDAPVSNSGRLKSLLYEMAVANNFPWDVEIVNNPDKTLVERNNIVISSDSWIIDHADHWSNLGHYIIDNKIPEANILKLI